MSNGISTPAFSIHHHKTVVGFIMSQKQAMQCDLLFELPEVFVHLFFMVLPNAVLFIQSKIIYVLWDTLLFENKCVLLAPLATYVGMMGLGMNQENCEDHSSWPVALYSYISDLGGGHMEVRTFWSHRKPQTLFRYVRILGLELTQCKIETMFSVHVKVIIIQFCLSAFCLKHYWMFFKICNVV